MINLTHTQGKSDKSHNIKGRILQYIDYKGISITKFYQESGISYGILTQNSKMNEENIVRILTKCRDLSPDWLLLGEGSMLKLEGKGIVQSNKGVENSSVPIIKSYPKSQKIDNGIPLVDISAAAGFGTLEFAIEEKNVIARYVIPDFKGADMMMPIVGDSMEPKYTAGDIVACKILNDNKYIQWGKVYIVATKTQGFMLKRLYCSNAEECLECKSYNPEYPPFLIEKNDITGIAIVVGSIHLESLM